MVSSVKSSQVKGVINLNSDGNRSVNSVSRCADGVPILSPWEWWKCVIKLDSTWSAGAVSGLNAMFKDGGVRKGEFGEGKQR